MILVTGGTGLVGSHLLFDLCKSGKKVRALKRATSNIDNVKKVFSYYSKNAAILFENIEWVTADLANYFSLLDAMEGVTEVYHCAALVSFDKKDEAEMININVEGTCNMVNAALEKGLRKFCHVSSIATFGSTLNNTPITEDLFWKPSPKNSNYAISKYAAECEVWRASEEGLNVIIVNPSLIIGPGNWNQSSSNLFNTAFQGMKYYTNGANGFIDVRDVSALMIALMGSEIINQRFILNSENRTYKYFFDLMLLEFNKPKLKYKVNKLICNFAWRLEKLRSIFTGLKPMVTKETMNSALQIKTFSNDKIKKAFQLYKFTTIEQSIKDSCQLYLKDKNNKIKN